MSFEGNDVIVLIAPQQNGHVRHAFALLNHSSLFEGCIEFGQSGSAHRYDEEDLVTVYLPPGIIQRVETPDYLRGLVSEDELEVINTFTASIMDGIRQVDCYHSMIIFETLSQISQERIESLCSIMDWHLQAAVYLPHANQDELAYLYNRFHHASREEVVSLVVRA